MDDLVCCLRTVFGRTAAEAQRLWEISEAAARRQKLNIEAAPRVYEQSQQGQLARLAALEKQVAELLAEKGKGAASS